MTRSTIMTITGTPIIQSNPPLSMASSIFDFRVSLTP
jgi:hypothetical protein